MARFYDPGGIWRPFGTFSQAAVLGGGNVVYLKGQVALDADGAKVGVGDMAAQVEQVHENIRLLLESFGGCMADIVSLTQHTTDIAAFMTTGPIRQRYFAPPYPVTTTVEVRALYDPELLVEITAVAQIPDERFVELTDAENA